MTTLLDVGHLSVHFFTRRGVVEALDEVTFGLQKGRALGLVGETGCGKSVTARAILNLVPKPGRIVGGEIRFEGQDLLELHEDQMREIRGTKIALIFQDPMTSLNPVLTIGYQLMEPYKVHQKLGKTEAWSKGVQMMDLVRIPSARARMKDYPHQFSGGMRQRVMIAMSLACNPELLLADEPTTALDVTIQAQILELMRNLMTQFDAALLLITHDLAVVAETCDRVAVMYAGNITEIADVAEIFKEPMHPYTVGLLRAIPSAALRKDWLDEIPGSVPSLIDPPKGCRFHPRCKYAEKACSEEKPKLVELEPGHFVSCHVLPFARS